MIGAVKVLCLASHLFGAEAARPMLADAEAKFAESAPSEHAQNESTFVEISKGGAGILKRERGLCDDYVEILCDPGVFHPTLLNPMDTTGYISKEASCGQCTQAGSTCAGLYLDPKTTSFQDRFFLLKATPPDGVKCAPSAPPGVSIMVKKEYSSKAQPQPAKPKAVKYLPCAGDTVEKGGITLQREMVFPNDCKMAATFAARKQGAGAVQGSCSTCQSTGPDRGVYCYVKLDTAGSLCCTDAAGKAPDDQSWNESPVCKYREM